MRYPQGGGLTPERQAFRERMTVQLKQPVAPTQPIAVDVVDHDDPFALDITHRTRPRRRGR
ncbi:MULTISPECIES: hypothetical protein [Streptomyces]|uniref:hypothetical protein n=1 Tax=Streptomyces TaxID=1883 RepID=UPI0015FC46D4|nr:hypothetical protein [Streptomyces sp. GMR22]MBA6434607.1 hypothetical protein [Streptomyces sp. GMR22]